MDFKLNSLGQKVLVVDVEIFDVSLWVTSPSTTTLTIPQLIDEDINLVNYGSNGAGTWTVGVDTSEGLTLGESTSSITLPVGQSIQLRYDVVNKNFIIAGRSTSSGGGGGAVSSVNGQIGDVVLTKSSIGLGNVDNTSDVNKPVSTAQATAISTAQSTAIVSANSYTDTQVLGKENTVNKASDYTVINNTKYPTTQATENQYYNKTSSDNRYESIESHLDATSNTVITSSTGNLIIRNLAAGSINLVNSGTTINGSGINFLIPQGKYASLHRDPSDNTKYIAEVIDITSSDVTFSITSDNQYTASQRGNVIYRDNFLYVNFSQRNAVGLTYDLPNPASNAPIAWYIYNDRASVVTIRDASTATITTISVGEGKLFIWTPSAWKVIGLNNITGLITQGTNVTITGSGTVASPYVINSTGGGGGTPDSFSTVTGQPYDNQNLYRQFNTPLQIYFKNKTIV